MGYLIEDLFLLALHEDKCSLLPLAAGKLPFGLGAAALIDLALAGKLRIGEGHRVELVDSSSTQHVTLDKAQEKIQASDHPRKTSYWIGLFSERPKKLYARLAERLEAAGSVKSVEKGLTWARPSPQYPELDASAKYGLKSRLREEVLACGETDLYNLALLNLLKACGLLDLIFLKDERKLAQRRIHELMVGEALRNPLAETVEEVGATVESMLADD